MTEEDYRYAQELEEDLKEFAVPHFISLTLKALCEDVPSILPNYVRWRIPHLDIVEAIREKMASQGYIVSLFPLLRAMLDSNIGNRQWTAQVIVGIALYDVLLDWLRSRPVEERKDGEETSEKYRTSTGGCPVLRVDTDDRLSVGTESDTV